MGNNLISPVVSGRFVPAAEKIEQRCGWNMSIRAIARDLYSVQQKIDRLEKEMATASPAEQEVLRGKLKQAGNELAMLRRILEGEKESAQFRKKFQGFGK